MSKNKSEQTITVQSYALSSVCHATELIFRRFNMITVTYSTLGTVDPTQPNCNCNRNCCDTWDAWDGNPLKTEKSRPDPVQPNPRVNTTHMDNSAVGILTSAVAALQQGAPGRSIALAPALAPPCLLLCFASVIV